MRILERRGLYRTGGGGAKRTRGLVFPSFFLFRAVARKKRNEEEEEKRETNELPRVPPRIPFEREAFSGRW